MTRRGLLLRLLPAALLAACAPQPTATPEPAAPPPGQPQPTATTRTGVTVVPAASVTPAFAYPAPPPSPTMAPRPTAPATPAQRLRLPNLPNDPFPSPVMKPAPIVAAATPTPLRPSSPTPSPPGVGLTPRPTDTPRPTPPPAPTPGQRVPIQKITKWGIGVYRESNETLDDLYLSKPTTILLMDPTAGWARRMRDWFPRAFVIGRRFRHEAAQPLDNPGPRGAAFADDVARDAVPLKGVIDAWMSYNEVTGHNGYEDYKRYNEFQVAFARRLQDTHGVAAVAGNDGSGTVEPPDYPKYFADAIRASRYFGLHAYSPLGSNWMQESSEWNTLRYRKVHAELERAGIRDVRMVITESGLGDGSHARSVPDDILAEQFFWFTDELEKDSYMIGHAAYGLFAGQGIWKAFELHGTEVLHRMGYYEPPTRRR